MKNELKSAGQLILRGFSMTAPVRNFCSILCLSVSHSFSRNARFSRTSSSIFRVLMKLLHSLFEIVGAFCGKFKTRLVRIVLPGTAGQRLDHGPHRQRAGRVVSVAKNPQQAFDPLSLLRAEAHTAMSART